MNPYAESHWLQWCLENEGVVSKKITETLTIPLIFLSHLTKCLGKSDIRTSTETLGCP